MASVVTDNDKYKLARKEQDFFRDAIKFCMAGEVENLDKHLKEFLSKDSSISAQDLLIGYQTEGRTLVHIATNSGHFEVLDIILKNCENPKTFVNLADDRGFTPLINATISESDRMMTELISLGADVNMRNKDGAAAIHFAAGDGGVSRMKILADAGADLTVHSKLGGSPIHWAAGKGRSEAIAFLVTHGADVNAVSNEGVPPVIMASVAACDLGVKSLVEAGADVGLIVSGGLTALHICAEHGLLAAVAAIVSTESGAKCANVETVDGNKPIHLAAMSSHKDVIRALLPHTDGLKDELASVGSDEAAVAALVDAVVADGKRRLAEWESKYQPLKSAEASTASAAGGDAAATIDPHSAPVSVSAEDDVSAEKLKEVGNSLYKAKAYAQAIKAYTSAIEINRYNATYYSNRSACYLTMGDASKALEDAEMCRRLKPEWAKGCYRLAAARLALDLYEDAAVAAFEGCKLDDKNQDLKVMLQTAVKKGQEAHRKTLAEAKK